MPYYKVTVIVREENDIPAEALEVKLYDDWEKSGISFDIDSIEPASDVDVS